MELGKDWQASMADGWGAVVAGGEGCMSNRPTSCKQPSRLTKLAHHFNVAHLPLPTHPDVQLAALGGATSQGLGGRHHGPVALAHVSLCISQLLLA